MKYKLIISPRAKQDRDRAFEWYTANYSKEFADRWYEGISNAVESLRRDPMRCAQAHEADQFPFAVYELLYGRRRNKHRILFTIHDDTVVILHLRHSAQRDLIKNDLDFSAPESIQ
jgi:plasmid stabilization system protein ParE